MQNTCNSFSETKDSIAQVMGKLQFPLDNIIRDRKVFFFLQSIENFFLKNRKLNEIRETENRNRAIAL